MKRRSPSALSLVLLMGLTGFLAAGCGGRKEAPVQQQPAQDQPAQEQPAAEQPAPAPRTDTVTTASVVNTEEAFLNAVGPNGVWLVAVLQDLTIDRDIVVEGSFTDENVPARKIALYAQDESRNVTQRYTLTAPRLVIRSENTRLQGGTFVGDVMVEANGFLITDATVQGNVYFANEGFRSTFKMESGGNVTGETAVR